jgi:hypothetical protein
VPPAKFDALLRDAMGKDYARMAPRLDGDRLVVQDGPVGHPVSLAVEASRDGSLRLTPTSILGRSAFLESPQMLVGTLLKPLTALIPDDPRQSVNLAKVSGADLPPLAGRPNRWGRPLAGFRQCLAEAGAEVVPHDASRSG